MKAVATPQHAGINFETEEILTLPEACKLVKPKPASLATIHRWVNKGIRGVKLETIAVGGRKLTSTQAMTRFIAALNAPETPVPTITPSQRRRQSEAAREELSRMGIRTTQDDPETPVKSASTRQRKSEAARDALVGGTK